MIKDEMNKFISVLTIAIAFSSNGFAENGESINFPVVKECVDSVKIFTGKLQAIRGFQANYFPVDYDAGMALGVAGFAIFSSEYMDRKSLEAYVNGAIKDCRPKRRKILDLFSSTGLEELSEFLEIRRNFYDAYDGNIYILIEEGDVIISF